MRPARETGGLCPWCSAVKVRRSEVASVRLTTALRWDPLGSDDAQVTGRHRSPKVSGLSAPAGLLRQFCPAHAQLLTCPCWTGLAAAPQACCSAAKTISAVIAPTLPILSINPDGISGAAVAVRENKFTYLRILSFELESLYERERACASRGHVETVATMFGIARQQTLRNCR